LEENQNLREVYDLMKRKILSLVIIGFFFAAGILSIPAKQTNNNNQEEINDIPLSTLYEENNVYIGETWTIYEPEVFTGSSNADVVNMTAEWIINPGDNEAHGTLGFETFDFNFAEEEKNVFYLPLATTTICDYEFTIFDGPSINDDKLTSGHNSFMGGGLKYEEMNHPFDVETKNQDIRTLAFQMNAKTQTYIPGLRMTVETPTGSISKLGQMVIDFITPSEKQKKLQDEKPLVIEESVELDLGNIFIYTSDPPNIPRCDLDPNQFDDPFYVNESELIEIRAYFTYEISIMEKAHPPILSFLLCQIMINLRAMASDNEQHYQQISEREEYKHVVRTVPFINESCLHINLTLDTDRYPSGCEFLVDYFLNVPSLFGMQINHPWAADSAKISIRWEPI
jgi:hypothetical protein